MGKQKGLGAHKLLKIVYAVKVGHPLHSRTDGSQSREQRLRLLDWEKLVRIGGRELHRARKARIREC